MTTIEDAAREFYAPGSRLKVAVEVEQVPYPAPAVTSRDWQNADIPPWPNVVRALETRALGAGWSAMAQYSRGQKPHGTLGTPGVVKDWFCVRMRSGDSSRAAYAIHDGKAWADICVWGHGISPYTECGMTELNEWIAGVGDPAGWVQSIRDRLAKAAAEKKKREQENPTPKRARASEAL